MINGRTDVQTDGRTDTQNFSGHNIIPAHFLWRGIKRKKIYFLFSVLGKGGGGNNFFLQRIEIYTFFFVCGGGLECKE